MDGPRIWVLTGGKTGDNAQVLRAARAMGLPFETRGIVLKPEFETAKPLVAPSLHHVDLERSDALGPPWPALVVTIGRRLSLVALWIRQQSAGESRIALFNAAKGEAADFDLVVAPAHYRLRDGPRVCRIGLPLIAADPARLAAAAARFAGQLGRLPKPLHVLLLGGGTGAMPFAAAFALDVLRQMRASFATGGSLYISTSRRTPAAIADALEPRLEPGDRLYRWSAPAEANPYLGLLAHGDTFTVTGDSLSMLTEVARLGKPLVIAPLPAQVPGALRRLRRLLGLGQLRDFQAMFDLLYSGGHAVPLGSMPRTPPQLPDDDTRRVAERLRHLASAGTPGYRSG